MSARLALHLLGAPILELNNSPIIADRRKTLALLAYLAVDRWQHHRDHISALFWPDYDRSKAFSNLRHILWEVQQLIGEGWVIARRDTIELIAEGADQASGRVVWLDVAHFKSLIIESQSQKDLSRRIPRLVDSVRLYRNHFLTGFSTRSPEFNEWASAESEDLRHQFAGALAMLSEDHCSLGEADKAIPYAQRLVALDSLNETSHRLLIQAYIQAGQNGSALKQYQTCEQSLRKELGVDPQPETRALYRQIRNGENKAIQPIQQRETSAPQHNFPYQLSKFIGRGKELGEITELISDQRLVTLVGTGGIGKTRLSLKVGKQVLNEYANGVWFVELASLNDPALVPQTVAKLFNLVEQAEESITEKLIRVLRPKTVLLILDNCEHLLGACAKLADTLLKNCLNLKVLATSREPLGITGESLYNVPTLGLPDLQVILEKLLEYESVQLFEERARLVQEHFSLTMENASSVTHICHRLDGIPLAIELAAARVNLLSAEQIALRLDESFNLLTGGSRTTLPRHQTLRASINWSWQLLSEPEQILLRRLSIFAGGWTLDAAESVCAGNGIEPKQVLDVMTQLVAKSLVVVNQEAERERRYHLLEMVRQYAHEKLLEAGEEENIHAQHLRYFLNLSEQIEYELTGPQQVEWYARAHDERDNLRAALEQAAIISDVEVGLYISGRLRNFWENFDMREGARWLAAFLQRPESKEYPLARAKALYAQAYLLLWLEQSDQAHVAAEECLALYRACGDQHGEVDGLILLGFILGPVKSADFLQQALAQARSFGDIRQQAGALSVLGWDHRDFKRVFAYWEEATALFRQAGDWRNLATKLSELGFFLLLDGNIGSAQKCLDEARSLFQQMNMKVRKGHLLIADGQIALLQGDYERARACFQENATIDHETGNWMDHLWTKARLGNVEVRAGNIDVARRLFTETVEIFQKDGNSIGVIFVLERMVGLYSAVGKPEFAAQLLGCADLTRKGIGDTRPVLEQADMDRAVAAIVEKIGKAAFDDAYHKGCGMTLDEAVAYALEDGSSA